MNRMELEFQSEEVLDVISAEPDMKNLVEKQLQSLENGLDQAEFLTLLSKHLNDKKHQQQLLLQQNEMLRVELTHIHELLQVEDQQDLVELKRQKQFDNEIRALDDLLERDNEFGSSIDMSLTPGADMTIEVDESSVFEDNCPDIFTVATKYFKKQLKDGKVRVVVPLCKAVIANMKPKDDTERFELATIMQTVAIITCKDKRQCKEAADIMVKVLNIYDDTLSADNPIILATLQNLSNLYIQNKCYTDAEPLCLRAVELTRSKFHLANTETSNRNLAQELNSMGALYKKMHKPEMAAKYYHEFMTLDNQSSGSMPDERVNGKRKRLADNILHQQPLKKSNNHDRDNAT